MIAWWWLIPVGLACFGLGIVALLLAVIFADIGDAIRAGKEKDA